MIICGYAGIGKSTLSKNYPMVIDLESTPFEKDWDRYAKCAIYYSNQGYLVLISCHKEIRERICNYDNGVKFGNRITIVPSVEDKELYRERYKNRGNTQEFIDMQMNNWEKWLDEKENKIINEHWEVMKPGETLYDTIIRLSKLPPYKFCSCEQYCLADECGSEETKCYNPLKPYVLKF